MKLRPGKILIPVHPKVMWAKFEALAAGARLATAELPGPGGRLGLLDAATSVGRVLGGIYE